MVKEFIRAFTLVFLAEMGDKTQIIAMTFATRYLIKDVIVGVTLGVLANHGLAIILGGYLSKSIPLDLIQVIAGFMFIIFGFSSLRNEQLDEFKGDKSISPIITVAITFFIGELGDKTQLTALTLALESSYILLILAGTTVAMVATSLLGIFIGSKIGKKVPEIPIKIISSIIFVTLGSLKFTKSLPSTMTLNNNLFLFITVIILLEMVLIFNLVSSSKSVKKLTPMKQVANDIYQHTELLKRAIDRICLGKGKCGKCVGGNCLIGYTRLILDNARNNSEYYSKHYIKLDKLLRKDYSKDKVLEALTIIILENEEIGWNEDENYIVNKVRFAIEYILLGESIKESLGLSEYLNVIKNINYKLGNDLEKGILSFKESPKELYSL